MSIGSVVSMRTAERALTTMRSAKPETPKWWLTGPSGLSHQRRVPLSSTPAVLDAAPGSHSAGRPSAQGKQAPQLGTKANTT